MPGNAHFWQVSLLNIVRSKYPEKSLDYRNFILDFNTQREVEDKGLVDTLTNTLATVKEKTRANTS